MEGSFRFSLAAAAKISMAHPCTNVPTRCKKGSCGRFVWKYNLLNHWENRHAGDTPPKPITKAAALSSKEKKWVKHVGEGHRIPPEWNTRGK